MAVACNGPALDQRIEIYQGSSAIFTIPVRDPAPPPPAPPPPPPDLSNYTAAWWVGPRPVTGPLGSVVYVAGSPGTFTKPLEIVSDGTGGYQVVLPVEAADVAGFAPGGYWQHEVWIKGPDGKAGPVTIGQLVVFGTVAGASA